MKVEVQIYSDGKNNQGHAYKNCLLFFPQDMLFVGSSIILTGEKQIRILCKNDTHHTLYKYT